MKQSRGLNDDLKPKQTKSTFDHNGPDQRQQKSGIKLLKQIYRVRSRMISREGQLDEITVTLRIRKDRPEQTV